MESLHTLFFAQIMGLYLILTAIIMLTRRDYYQRLLTNIKPDSSSIVVAGALGLIFGLIVVLTHNIWLWESEVLITIVGWGLVVKSVLWLSFPESMANYCRKVYGGIGYYILILIMVVVGVILTAHGYYLFSLKP
jgi:hypothetical protein